MAAAHGRDGGAWRLLQLLRTATLFAALLDSSEDASAQVGIVFALASGVVVGNGASSGGTNALVGVAISASLLPPVVNSGMCVAYGLLGPAWEPVAEWQWDAEPFPSTEAASSDAGGELLSEVAGITGLGYRQKLLVLGAISFALYLMNITVILFVCWRATPLLHLRTPRKLSVALTGLRLAG